MIFSVVHVVIPVRGDRDRTGCDRNQAGGKGDRVVCFIDHFSVASNFIFKFILGIRHYVAEYGRGGGCYQLVIFTKSRFLSLISYIERIVRMIFSVIYVVISVRSDRDWTGRDRNVTVYSCNVIVFGHVILIFVHDNKRNSIFVFSRICYVFKGRRVLVGKSVSCCESRVFSLIRCGQITVGMLLTIVNYVDIVHGDRNGALGYRECSKANFYDLIIFGNIFAIGIQNLDIRCRCRGQIGTAACLGLRSRRCRSIDRMSLHQGIFTRSIKYPRRCRQRCIIVYFRRTVGRDNDCSLRHSKSTLFERNGIVLCNVFSARINDDIRRKGIINRSNVCDRSADNVIKLVTAHDALSSIIGPSMRLTVIYPRLVTCLYRDAQRIDYDLAVLVSNVVISGDILSVAIRNLNDKIILIFIHILDTRTLTALVTVSQKDFSRNLILLGRILPCSVIGQRIVLGGYRNPNRIDLNRSVFIRNLIVRRNVSTALISNGTSNHIRFFSRIDTICPRREFCLMSLHQRTLCYFSEGIRPRSTVIRFVNITRLNRNFSAMQGQSSPFEA